MTFLQEQELFATPLDPGEIVTFLKENPKLDKKQIGEYICNKKHKPILEAYQKYVDLYIKEIYGQNTKLSFPESIMV